jgi:hypothetical protein
MPGAKRAPVDEDVLTRPALVATPLAEAQPPYEADDISCGGMRPTLRFGWIETVDEVPPPTPDAVACLAVYQLPGTAPEEFWQ